MSLLNGSSSNGATNQGHIGPVDLLSGLREASEARKSPLIRLGWSTRMYFRPFIRVLR
jgi:hypothetical protein